MATATLDLVRDAIVSAGNDGTTVKDLATSVNASKSTVQKAVKQLVESGDAVKSDDDGRYRPPADNGDAEGDDRGGRRRNETLEMDQKALDLIRAGTTVVHENEGVRSEQNVDGLTRLELSDALGVDRDGKGKPVNKTAFMSIYRLQNGTSTTFPQIRRLTDDDGKDVKREGNVVWVAIASEGTIFDQHGEAS